MAQLLVLCAVLMQPVAPASAADAPYIVYARSPAGAEIFVNWEYVVTASGAVTYRVYRSTSLGGTYQPIADVSGQYNFVYIDRDPALRYSTQYFYKVSSIDNTGESVLGPPTGSPSLAAQYIGPMTNPPPAPLGVVATTESAKVMLTWDAVPGPNVEGYIVYRSSQSGVVGSPLNAEPISATSFVDECVVNYEHYWYRVATVDDTDALGPRSLEAHARPEADVPAYVPHGNFAADTDSCIQCHVVHSAEVEKLLKSATLNDLCFTCHDGTGSQNVVYQDFASEDAQSRHPVAAGTMPGHLSCGGCHEIHMSVDETAKLLSVGGVSSGNEVCYGCHDGSDLEVSHGVDFRVFEDSSHNDAVGAPPSGTEVVCSTCHLAHSSPNDYLWVYSGYQPCFNCHSGGEGAIADIYTRLNTSNDPSMRHDILARDQAITGARIACQNCHNSHTVSAVNPVIDPYNPSPEGALEGTGRQFCESCHDGTLPLGVDTQPWVDPPLAAGGSSTTANVKSFYVRNRHGEMDGIRFTRPLIPEMGYMKGSSQPPLECTVCHDPHGAVNYFNLRHDVSSADGSLVREGYLVYKDPATGRYDLRFFCNSCHRIHRGNHPGQASRMDWPGNCLQGNCHQHDQTGRPNPTF